MSFFKAQVSSSSNFASLFSVITHNSFVLFWLKHYILSTKVPLLALKFTKFLMSLLEPRVSFSTNVASFFSVMRQNSSVPFHLKLYVLWTKGAYQKANFQTYDCSNENSNSQIPYVIYQAKSQFSFKFCIILHGITVSWHIIPMKFSSWNIICFGQKEHIKVQFPDFWGSNESSPNSPCHFWNHKVRVYSNFASPFSVIKDNSSVFL